jgi:paraquat-inducible protein B
MAKRISASKVGAFVLAALLLAALGIAILGGGDLFNAKDRWVVYFDGSMKGLLVGTSVTFRGVEVGRVASIRVIYNSKNNSSEIPVVIELESGRISGLKGNKAARAVMLQTMIDQGLRAQLSPDSYLANTELIQLDFFPGSKANLHANTEPYPQIPSVPSTLQQLQYEVAAAMQRLPQLTNDLDITIKSLNGVMSPQNRQHFSEFLTNAAAITASIGTHQAEISDAVTNLDQTSQHLASATRNLDQILAEDRAPLKSAIANINQTAVSAHALTDQLNGMLAEDRAGLKQFSNGTLPQLGGLLVGMRQAVHRTNDTLDALDRDPSSFLFSKKTQGIPAK